MSPLAALAASVSPWRAGGPTPAAPGLGGVPASAREARATPSSRLRRSLRACTAEGLFAEVFSACAGGAVLTGWAIHLRVGTLVTGIVVALPQLAQVAQIPGAWTTAWLGHRRACIGFVLAARLVALPLALLPFWRPPQATAGALLIAVASAAALLAVLGNNAWTSWMGELVPRRIRGRYFGRRAGLCTAGGAVASAGAGLLLDWARPRGLEGAALAALQVVAGAVGVTTAILMARQHDPSPLVEVPPRSLRPALRPFGDRSVRGLLAYLAAWNLAVGVAGSFFSLHMLQNLRMGFTLIALHGAALATARVVAAPLWGRAIDRLGARPVLATCSFGIAAIPLIWFFATPARLWPLAFDALSAGVLWGGHSLATFALPLSVTPRRGRPHYLAAFSLTSGVSFSLATALAGALAGALPARFALGGHAFFSLEVLFAVTVPLRLGAAFLALRIQEPAAARVGALFAERRPAPASEPRRALG
ncbi:MAG TPA: MFS transporter [Polyangia bacterium]|nr:MFS transporter [Polyangia bacterium]